jgi:FkbM family methyltransferase
MKSHQLLSRAKQIASFSRTGRGIAGRLTMAVAGYARGHQFSGPSLSSRIGRFVFPRCVAKIKAFNGLKVELDPTDLSQLVVAEEVLVEGIYDLNVVPFKPDIIVDCGAHIGLFSMLAASRFTNSKLVAFEPDPINYGFLERHILINGLSVEATQAAVSIADGKERFKAGDGCGSALTDATNGNTVTVTTVNLEAYIASLACARLVLKMDVEGAEEKIIPNIADKLPAQCVLFLETHAGDESWKRCARLLEAQGFVVEITRRRDLYTDGTAVRNGSRNS